MAPDWADEAFLAGWNFSRQIFVSELIIWFDSSILHFKCNHVSLGLFVRFLVCNAALKSANNRWEIRCFIPFELLFIVIIIAFLNYPVTTALTEFRLGSIVYPNSVRCHGSYRVRMCVVRLSIVCLNNYMMVIKSECWRVFFFSLSLSFGNVVCAGRISNHGNRHIVALLPMHSIHHIPRRG